VDGAAGINLTGHNAFRYLRHGALPSSLEKRQFVDRRWEIFAVRYVTMIEKVPDNVRVEVAGAGVNYDGQEYTLYKLTDPRPFAHLVYDAIQFHDPNMAREFMVTEPYLDLRETALVADPLPFELSGERPANPEVNQVIAFNMSPPEYIEMQVSTEANALLTLPIANYPGWQAQINGRDVDILDTYSGLIGIPIPPGANQKVTLHFVPQTVFMGAIISVLALIAVAGYEVVRRFPLPTGWRGG
jgi:hypothetical protein